MTYEGQLRVQCLLCLEKMKRRGDVIAVFNSLMMGSR